jgi:hypothetical protein
MRASPLLILIMACGVPKPAESPASASASASSTPTPTPTPTPNQVATPSSTSTPPPPATGGSVLVGDIAVAKKFNPKPVIEASKPALLECYNQVRGAKPSLAGKLKLLIQVNEAGAVLKVDSEPGGSANDPALVACIGEALKNSKFPRPGGMATVFAPLLFRP